MKHTWINDGGLCEYAGFEIAEVGFKTLSEFGGYLESEFGLLKNKVLRGPDVDIVFFGKGDLAILLVLDQDGEDCLRAKDENSNELLNIVAENLEGRRYK
jgi:hypothetical protein